MHLAYRWFTRLGFDQEIPDHSTFSKNRHGRFRQSGVFRKVFEEIVRRCLEAGVVEGRNVAVDGTLVGANVSPQNENVRFVQSRNVRFHGWPRALGKRSESL
jgi:transposase